MRAEVIAVGTELLLGDIANTNAQAIGRELARIGVDCHVHVAVGDNVERIAEAISASLERADAVILTGGLGPTQDDVTREAIALATGDELVEDPALVEDLHEKFARLGRPMASINLRQAQRPSRARALPNPLGPAPGILAELHGKVLYAIPGVPSEMIAMLHASVLPDLSLRARATSSI